ncbi:MAG: elongation factor 1-beta [Candidatus Altiarchaeota archaeon]|nr:elongation factor 1-beta [Candidatus Altiarchaeota archaeon]
MTDWNVVVNMKIMPEGVETDLKKISEEIRKLESEKCKVHSMAEKPIAFGLKALEVNLLFNDKQGGMDEIQEKISKIPGVSEAEVTGLNRL